MITFTKKHLEDRGISPLSRFSDDTKRKLAISAQGPWIAGGWIRNQLTGKYTSTDVDVFFRNEEQFIAAKSAFQEDIVRENIFNVTLSSNIQLIKISYFDDLPSVLDSFDFTICQFGFDGEKIVCSPEALADEARKRLVPHRVSYATSTVRRLLKYSDQGYYACGGCLATILQKVAQDPSIIRQDVEYID